jgi:hypothetical protein
MPNYFLKLGEVITDQKTGAQTFEERFVYVPAEARLILPRLREVEHIAFNETGLRTVELFDHPPAPELDVLEPSEARYLSVEPVMMTCRGRNFPPGAVIVFNGGDEPTNYVSPTEISTVVETKTVSGPVTVPVYVRNPDGTQSSPLDFTFTEPPPRGR